MRCPDAAGDLVVLEEQDRGRWDRTQIAEALPLVIEALRGGGGGFAVQAAIAAVHCQAAGPRILTGRRSCGCTTCFNRCSLLPVVRLNRAVAVAMAEGPPAGLKPIDGLAGELDGYHLLHAARADLLRRAGRFQAAVESYDRRSTSRPTIARRYLAKRRNH